MKFIRNRTQTLRYAVTVKNRKGLFQFLEIVRPPDDQIFFSYPAPLTAPDWRPHTSVHKDGHVHEKVVSMSG